MNLADIIFERRIAIENEFDLAMEGIFSSIGEGIGNVINSAKTSLALASVSDQQNLTHVKKLTNKIKGKQKLRASPPLIEINHYSKWLKYHGEVINDGSRIIHELERVRELSQIFLKAYVPALEHLFDYVADHFLKEALEDQKKAVREFAPTVAQFYPKQFDTVLNRSKGNVHKLVGDSAELVKVSNVYLGNWFIATHLPAHTGYTHLLPTVVNVAETPINGAEARMHIQPYDPIQVHQILNLVFEIMTTISSLAAWHGFKDHANKIERLTAQYELHHHNYSHYTEEQKVLVIRVIEITQSAFREHKNLTLFCEYVNRLCYVVLMVCDDSIHRME